MDCVLFFLNKVRYLGWWNFYKIIEYFSDCDVDDGFSIFDFNFDFMILISEL